MTQQSDDSETKPNRDGLGEWDPRVQLATERTLLAWVRTGLALMAFGFVVARFALILHSLGLKTNSFFTIQATVIGMLMVLLGVIANAGASLHYRKYFNRIGQSGTPPFAAWSLAVKIAFASALIGVALAIYLLLVDVSNWNLGETLKHQSLGD